MTIAGHLVWHRGMRGFVAHKRPADYLRRSDDVEPVAVFPLGADEFALSIAILEQRFPCTARLEDETKVKLPAVDA